MERKNVWLSGHTVCLLLILLTAVTIRWYRMEELATFRSDQAIELSGAKSILEGKLTLIGIKSSVSEVGNGAVMYYLLTPFLFFFRGHPIAGGILQTTLQIAAIVIVYSAIKKYENPHAALIAAYLLATSSLLVVFSRQTMLAFYPLVFHGVALYLLLRIAHGPERIRDVLLLGVLAGIMIQIHYSSVTILIAAMGFPIVCRKNIINFYRIFLAGFILGFLPMIVFELRHEFFQTQMFRNYLAQTGIHPAGENFSLLTYWYQATSAYLTAGNGKVLILILSALTIFRIKTKNKLSESEKVCILLLLSTIVYTYLFVKENIPHYILPAIIPLVFLTSTTAMTVLGSLQHATRKGIMAVCAVSVILINYPAWGMFDTHAYTMHDGWNQKGIEKAARIIKSDNPGEQFNVAMIIDAENQGLPLRYFLARENLNVLPTNQYDRSEKLYVIVEPQTDIADITVYEIQAFGAFTVEKTWEIQNGVRLMRLGKKQIPMSLKKT